MKKLNSLLTAMVRASLAAALTGMIWSEAPAADATDDRAAIEAELDRFREGLFQAYNEGDYKAMLEQYCHPNLIATWQDGTSSKGYDEVLAEFAKLKTFIDKMSAQPLTDKRLILNDGQLVIASGNMGDVYDLKRGVTVNLHSRWQATLVREDDRLLLVGFSASTDAFENEVVDLYLMQARYRSGAIGAAGGLLAGIIIARLVSRRRRERPAA